MRIRSLLAAGALLALGASASAPAVAGFSYCAEPRAPSAVFLMKPTKPVCYSGCSEWQVSQYKREVSSYFENLQQYASDVDRYYKRAGEYVQCMSDLS